MRLKDLLLMSHLGMKINSRSWIPSCLQSPLWVALIGLWDRRVKETSVRHDVTPQAHAAAAPELALSLCLFL